MAQGQGIKPKGNTYGYGVQANMAGAGKSGGVPIKRRDYKRSTPSQIIETQVTHQGFTKKTGK